MLVVMVAIAMSACGDESKTKALFKDINKDTGIHMKYSMDLSKMMAGQATSGQDQNGQSLSGQKMEMEIFIKGENAYVDTTAAGTHSITILKDGVISVLNPQAKTATQMKLSDQQKKLDAIDSLNANLIYENMNAMNAEMEVNKAQQEVAKTRLYWLTAVIILLIAVISLLFLRNLTRRGYQKRLLKKNKELGIALSRAEESDRMKTSFIEHVSHEIRTPINAVLGFNELIIRECSEAKDRISISANSDPASEASKAFSNISTYAGNIQNAGGNLLSIINDILDISKIEAGKMDIIEAAYTLSSLLNDVSNLVFFKAKEKNLKFAEKRKKYIYFFKLIR